MYYQDSHITIYNKNCLDMEIADESVQCVVTSPPYWGLRKYSGEQDIIWGDNHCEHQWNLKENEMGVLASPKSTLAGYTGETVKLAQKQGKWQSGFCSLCCAWKGAYGLEPTPEMYVQHTIEILREIRRVLRKDGVVFLNLGDSYMSGGGASRHFGYTDPKWPQARAIAFEEPQTNKHSILKPKDLCLIPFRVTIAAQEDGWWVRSVIIWSKPNPMPESVTDRPTESHEYILMLTKSKNYYWDADAVRENLNSFWHKEWSPKSFGGDALGEVYSRKANREDRPPLEGTGRNIRSVWEFPTQPYPEAHFAVFPEKLPELCIKAATSEKGCCGKCGAPWERITSNKPMKIRRTDWGDKAGNRTASSGTMISPNESKTLGWQPTCKCFNDVLCDDSNLKDDIDSTKRQPCIVLDPFMGSGTTLWVAKKLGRKAIGYDTSEEYCKLAVERNRQQVLL